MFETLTKGFRATKNRLAGVAELSEENIDQALRDVRLSLLEADVEFGVVKRFLATVKEKALGEVVQLKWGISNRFCNPSLAQILPSQDVVVSAYFQAAGDFLIGFGNIAHVATEPVLVHFLVGLQVPQTAGIGADLVG